MNLKYLSDDELVSSIESAVQRERESLTDVLNHIAEVCCQYRDRKLEKALRLQMEPASGSHPTPLGWW